MPTYVIIGASQGLGYAWLEQLTKDPQNTVVGLVRTPSNVTSRLESDGLASKVHLLKADMADHVSLTAAANEVSKLVPNGAVDYLIINGVHPPNPAENFSNPTEFTGKEDLITQEMISSVKVNVLGTIFSINAFLPLVRKSKVKKIAVISTGLADLDEAQKGSVSFTVSYSSSKAAVNMVVARYSVELRGEGIVILALSPGFVDTQGDKPQAEMPAQIQERVGLMLKDFKTMDPNFSGPITTEESVTAMKSLLERITIEQSGMFLSHHGNKHWL
ncbi:hypothetical protein F5884DRAFT_786070 [Xylogone sp. PMI_703]|nr:hypothetical protein F5884DRAFT_786070 [Xylogone sp. PMI_703]